MTQALATTSDADMIRVNEQGVAVFTAQAAQLVRSMLCAKANDLELAFFASYCRRLNLDPFSGHVHLVERGTSGNKVCRPEVSLAGKLLIAERSGKYRGRTAYEWCGPDKVWTEVWLEQEPPAAARVGVYREGSPEPIWATAVWASYVGTKYGGEVNSMWKQHGPRMIGKCALSLALSEALPAELGGVYTIEEMGQSDNPVAEESLTPEQESALLDLHARAGTADAVAKVRVENTKAHAYESTVAALEQRIHEQESVEATQADPGEACGDCKGTGSVKGDECGACGGSGLA